MKTNLSTFKLPKLKLISQPLTRICEHIPVAGHVAAVAHAANGNDEEARRAWEQATSNSNAMAGKKQPAQKKY